MEGFTWDSLARASALNSPTSRHQGQDVSLMKELLMPFYLPTRRCRSFQSNPNTTQASSTIHVAIFYSDLQMQCNLPSSGYCPFAFLPHLIFHETVKFLLFLTPAMPLQTPLVASHACDSRHGTTTTVHKTHCHYDRPRGPRHPLSNKKKKNKKDPDSFNSMHSKESSPFSSIDRCSLSWQNKLEGSQKISHLLQT